MVVSPLEKDVPQVTAGTAALEAGTVDISHEIF
jgi:hypothetical protein